MQNSCLITIDVEEWFQVENLRSVFPENTWNDQKSTVTKNTERILKILDANKIKATFFILGLVAKNNPELVMKIANQGHEIASHGTGHELTYNLSDDQLLNDIKNSKIQIEKLINKKIYGYRAPNFSVSDRLINYLSDLNFKYDSSYNPFQLNQRYGKLDIDTTRSNDGIYQIKDNFYEIPLSAINFFGNQIPMAGGAYFRIYPFLIYKKLVKAKLIKDGLFHFYLHPWEFEPEQPKIKNIKLNYKIRHYTGLNKTTLKFEKLIQYLFQLDCQFLTISDYIEMKKIT